MVAQRKSVKSLQVTLNTDLMGPTFPAGTVVEVRRVSRNHLERGRFYYVKTAEKVFFARLDRQTDRLLAFCFSPSERRKGKMEVVWRNVVREIWVAQGTIQLIGGGK